MRYSKVIVLGVVFLICALAAHVAHTKYRDTVGYHLGQFNRLKGEVSLSSRVRDPKQPLDYLQPQTLHWYLRGKPTFMEEWDREQNALIRLRYFERRSINLTNRQFGEDGWKDVTLSNAFWGPGNSWVLYVSDKRPNWVRATGRDLERFEEIVRRWDAEKSEH